MPFCEDRCYHAWRAEADACTHRPGDKDFGTLNLAHPRLNSSRKRKQPTYQNDDDDDDLPTIAHVIPASRAIGKSNSKSPSPLGQQQGYPTPPFSQDADEDMDDNIITGMSSSSQMPSSSPAGAFRQSLRSSPSCANETSSRKSTLHASPSMSIHDDLDDIPFPLSSSPPPARSPSPAHSHGTTRVMETIPDCSEATGPDTDDNHPTVSAVELGNENLSLLVDRARLTDALATSTFRSNNLLTRGKLSVIDARLARAEAEKVRLREIEAWESVDAAREARRNARIAAWLVVVMGMVYAGWCWWNGEELEYIRNRRREAYGLK